MDTVTMLQRILVPLDGSELANAVLPYVRELGRRCQPVDVILLQVVRLPQGRTAAAFVPRDADFPGQRMPDSEADVETVQHPIYRDQEMSSVRIEVEAELAAAARELREAGIAARVEVAFGRPAQEIVDYAEREGVDLIAMCSHGRSGISRWLLGSVADKVLRGTRVPVLLIRPPGGDAAPFPPQGEIQI